MASSSSYVFTSESVSEGHPDKICDRISDEILDMFLSKDPKSRVAVETLATTQQVVLAGEVRSNAHITKDDMINCARNAVKDIGYEQDGFHWRDMHVQCLVHEQSKDIAQGVDSQTESEKDEGAGDQGIMFGHARNETESLMPAPIDFSHRILRSLSEYRRTTKESGLGPDAKSQVTLLYENNKPIKATSVVVSTQHDKNMSQKQIRDLVCSHVENILPKGWMPKDEDIYVNPTGIFVIGGPDGDAGLTGRKIIVDTYGGAAPHGGGAFSGKDPSKVDRSAAYAARYLAKNVVAAGLADYCTIEISYAIGIAKPLSLYVEIRGGKENISEQKLSNALMEAMDLTPYGIRKKLDLHRPIYVPTSSYGHFGRTAQNGLFTWEKTDLVDDILAALS